MSVLLKLAWFFRLEWRRYAVALLTLLAIAVLTMLPPWLTGRVVDAVAERRLALSDLALHIGAIVVLALMVYVLRNIWRRYLYGASYRLASLLRQRLYAHLTRMAPGYFQKHRTGDLMARLTNDVSAVEMMAGEGVLAMVDGVLTGLVVLGVMVFTVSWKLTLLALLPWPLMAYFMWRYGDALHDAFATAQAEFSRLNDQVQETVTGIRLIKAHGHQARAKSDFCAVTTGVSRANLAVARIDAKYDPTIQLTIGSSFLLAVAGGAWWIAHDELTVGELTGFSMYLGYLIWPMFAYGWLLNILERGRAAYGRIDEVLGTAPDIADHGTRRAPQEPRLDIHIAHYAHPGGPDVLHDIAITVPPGATLGIVGPTGAGKSTLIDVILRMREGKEARISLAGHPLAAYRLTTLARQFGVVPQDPFLFSVTVAENIALGNPEASMAEIRAAAALACVDEDISGFAAGYETLVGERGITLSGGQQQRLALARALMLEPPLLVLDDALSAVDVRTERRILAHLRRARLGRSNLIVTHRLSAVRDADEIIVLEGGRVTERGSHGELLQHGGWYARMFRYQQIEQTLEGDVT